MNRWDAKASKRSLGAVRPISFYFLAAAFLAILTLYVTLPSAPLMNCRVGSDASLHVSKPGKTGEAPSDGIGEIPIVPATSWFERPPVRGILCNDEEIDFPRTAFLLESVRFRPPPLL